MKDFSNFITHLKFEAITLAALMVVLAYVNVYSAWWLLPIFLSFDIGMFGYLINSRVGAISYNLTHNLSVPTLLIAAGVYWDLPFTAYVGITWTFHIAVDRSFGFGLKHSHSFKETHLGKIKK